MINLFVYSHVVTLDQPISTPQYLMPLVEITLLPSCNNEKKYKPEVKVHTKYLIDTWQVL